MRYLIILLFTFSFYSYGLSESKLDTLVPLFLESDTDEQIEILFIIQPELERMNVDSLLYFLDIIYVSAEQENRSDVLAFYEYFFGSYLSAKGMQEAALQKYYVSLPFFQEENNDTILAILHNLIGNAYLKDGKLDLSEENYLLSTSYGKKSGVPKFEYFSFSNLFRVYLAQGRDEEAKEIIDLFIRFYQNDGNSRNLATGYGLLGQYYLNQGELENAVMNYERSLELNLADGAPLLVANGYTNMAIASFYQEDYLRAKQYFKLALSYREMVGLDFYTIESYHNLGDYFHGLSEYDSALVYYNKAAELATSSKNTKLLVDAYTEISDVYATLKMFEKQANTLQEIVLLNKKLYSEKSSSELAAMRVLFEKDKEALKRLTSQREEALQAKVASVKSNWNTWIWVFTGCCLFLIFIVYYTKQKSKQSTE